MKKRLDMQLGDYNIDQIVTKNGGFPFRNIDFTYLYDYLKEKFGTELNSYFLSVDNEKQRWSLEIKDEYKFEEFKKDKAKKVRAFAQGGMVDFTGPAWVDGTKSRPEAFLNADDTKRIGEAAKLLSDLPLLDKPRTQTN